MSRLSKELHFAICLLIITVVTFRVVNGYESHGDYDNTSSLEAIPADKVIEHDPVTALQYFLDTHPAWMQNDSRVFWKQEGWRHLKMEDYMISSIQVWSGMIFVLLFPCRD